MAGIGGHVVRRADGPGDRRVQAEPGRAADRAGARCGAGRRPRVPVGACAVGQDARRAGNQSDIYYLWSLERVCVALGLRSLDGFDWYARGAQILLDRQESDGGWPHDRWGRLPSTASPCSSCERPTWRSRSIACCDCPVRRPSWRWPRQPREIPSRRAVAAGSRARARIRRRG